MRRNNPEIYGWDNRKSQIINASDGAGTDYQVKIETQYASLSAWLELPSMKYGRQYPAVAVVNNKIYVIGGRAGDKDLDKGTRYNINEEYDPVTNQWTTKTPIPNSFDAAANVVYNNKIYIAGGYPNGDKHYVYDPYNNTWSDDPIDLPVKRWDCGGAIVGNYFYVIGGSSDQNAYNTIYRYDLENGVKWESKTNSTYNHAKTAVSVHDNKVYVFCSDWYDRHDHVEVYEPSTDSWTIKKDAPYRFIAATPTSIKGYIYLLRVTSGSRYIPNFYKYNPADDTYTAIDDFTLVDELISTLNLVNIGSNIYHCGGSIPAGYKTNRIFAYFPDEIAEGTMNLHICCIDGDSEGFLGALFKLSNSTGLIEEKVTNSTGWVKFSNLPNTTYSYEVWYWNNKVGEGNLSLMEKDCQVEIPIRIYDLIVQTVDEEGNNLTNAIVTLFWLNGTEIISKSTNITGRVEFQNMPGATYSIKATLEGYKDQRINPPALTSNDQIETITLQLILFIETPLGVAIISLEIIATILITTLIILKRRT